MPRHEPLWRRYLRFLGPDPVADADDELQFHLDELERRYRASGMDADAARRAARVQFGDVEVARHAMRARSTRRHRRGVRTERGLQVMQDIRLAVRKMIAQPGFTVAAVVTLALGIGANAAVFSVVNPALIRALPYPESDRLVVPQTDWKGGPFAISPPDFFDYAAQTHSFSGLAATLGTTMTLTGHGDPQPVRAARVTEPFFDVMRVAPARGHPFSAAEEMYGAPGVVILSDGLWRDAFGARPDILDQSVQLDGETYRVVGVMPPGFDFPNASRAWFPLAFSDTDLATQRGAHYLDAVARLKPGVTLAAATQDLANVAARLAQEHPRTNDGYTGTVGSLRDSIIGPAPRQALLILLGAVALVALIACANVANLLLARGAARAREMAVRTALGARSSDIIGQALVESVLLSLVGGALGIGVAVVATRSLDALRPESLRDLGRVHVDLAVLTFTVALSVVTGLIFGLAPALQASRAARLNGMLREGGRGGTISREGWRARAGLVAAEMALAVVLLAGAGLLIRSLVRLEGVDPGFNPSGAMTFDLSLPSSRYPAPQDAAQFYRRLSDQVSALPGVLSVGAMTGLPLDNYSFSISMHSLDGQDLPPERQPSAEIRIVTPGTFTTLGMHLVSGRDFTGADAIGAPTVVIVNQAAARLLWKDVDPIGHQVTIGSSFGLGMGRVGGEVIGVAADVHDATLDKPGRATIYLPHAQVPVSDLTLIVRSRGTTRPEALTGSLRARLHDLDPQLPIYASRPLDEVARAAVAVPRFATLLLGAFAALAATLAAVGIFGVMAFIVGQRTQEIGVRMALGASGSRVVGESLRRAAAPVVVGLAIGIGGALLLSRSMTSLLYGVQPSDPVTYAVVAAVLGALALGAAWVPARRASRIDPIEALRAD